MTADLQPDPAAVPAELVEAVARAIDARMPEVPPRRPETDWQDWRGEAEAAIAAVRAYDLARTPYATRAADGTVTLQWPAGRAGAVWVSAELIESLADLMAERGARWSG